MKPLAERLKRTLLTLPDAELRVGWLADKLRSLPSADAARALDSLCEDAESHASEAREVLVTIALLLAAMADQAWVDELRAHAGAERLLCLDRLIRRGPPASEPPLRPDAAPIPDYGAGRELSLGERRSLARRPSRQQFERLLADPHPLVIEQLLLNPKLTEADVVRLVTRRPARAELIRSVARSPRWLCRERVRLAILNNPGTPAEVAIPLLGLCTRRQLQELVHAADGRPVVRRSALERLERRPPLGPPHEQPLQ